MYCSSIFNLFNYTLSSGVHVQNVQVCYIGIHVPCWFAAFITLSSTLCISPNTIPPLPPLPSTIPPLALLPPNRPWCVMFPSQCPCVLIVQHPLTSENMRCLVFCSCVSLLRMMVSSFVHVLAKDMNLGTYTVFDSGCTHLYPNKQCIRVNLSPHLQKFLLFFAFYTIAIPIRV